MRTWLAAAAGCGVARIAGYRVGNAAGASDGQVGVI